MKLILPLLLAAAAHAQGPIRGFSAEGAARERALEAKLLAVPDARRIEAHMKAMASEPPENPRQAAMDSWLGSLASQTREANPMANRSQPTTATRCCGVIGTRCGCRGSDSRRQRRAILRGEPSDRRADWRASSADMPERRPASRDSIKWSSSSAASWVGRPANSELKGLEFIAVGRFGRCRGEQSVSEPGPGR